MFDAAKKNIPPSSQIEAIVMHMRVLQKDNESVAVCCGAGDGRSGIVKTAFVIKHLIEASGSKYSMEKTECKAKVIATLDGKTISGQTLSSCKRGLGYHSKGPSSCSEKKRRC